MVTRNMSFVHAAQGETARKINAMQLCKASRNPQLFVTITIFRLRADCLELSGTLFY